MADLAIGVNGTDPALKPVRTFPTRPKRRFRIDPEVVVDSVLSRVEQMRQDDFMTGTADVLGWAQARTSRYMKLRGLLPEKSTPWADCANVHLPLMMQHTLRAEAGLHNTAFSLRPLMGAKATNKVNAEREMKLAQLLDYQVFVEPGPELAERRITDYILGGCEDGNAVAFCDWVREEGTVFRVEHLPAIPADMAPTDYLDREFARLFPGYVRAELPELPDDPDEPPVNNVFTITFQRGEEMREAEAIVFQDEDGALTLELRYEATLYDGPIFTVLPITSVTVPTRCSNLQPPFPENPTGAAYVRLGWQYTIDEIRHKRKTGEFNYLDAEGLASIEASARRHAGLAPIGLDDPLEEAKDQAEGREHRTPDGEHEDDIGHIQVPFTWMFDRWDVDKDGRQEDVYWLIAEDAKVLCEGRYLTERWPAERPYRPLAEWCPIPVKGRWYGISFPELMESIYDFVKGILDQAIDGWTMATGGWFLYGQSSKMNADVIKVAPFQGIPVPGNPKETVFWPNLPQRDVTGALGIVGMSMQILDQLMMQGPLQRGQVPTGKSSALRTTGTTMALLQQGDVRADQLLLRWFNGVSQIYRIFHRMNRHFLPVGKEFRVVGWDGPDEQAYQKIDSIADVDVDMDFEFKPEFLNSNPDVLVAGLEKVLMMMMQPLAFQIGITDANLVHRTVQKITRAMRLDPKDHWKAPTMSVRPPISAEEAIAMAIAGQAIYGQPLEGAQAHLEKLGQYVMSEAVATLSAHPTSMGIFKAWWLEVAGMAQQEQLAQSSQGFADAQKSGTSGQPVAPSGGGEVPQIGTGDMAPTADAMATEVTGGAM